MFDDMFRPWVNAATGQTITYSLCFGPDRNNLRHSRTIRVGSQERRLRLSELTGRLIVATLLLACCVTLHAQSLGRDGSGNLAGRGSGPRDGAANLIEQGRPVRDGSGNPVNRGSAPRDGAANLLDRGSPPVPRSR
jgi:hypothetical protein